MTKDLIIAILLSISPFGESKAGIPYGMLNGANIYLVFIFCFLANLCVFPVMIFFLEKINSYLLKWSFYKKPAIYIAQRAKKGSGNQIKKYGFWGLILFVMIPLPGTGVYAGSIATYLFKINKTKGFMANTIGIFFSSIIVWVTTYFSMKGIG